MPDTYLPATVTDQRYDISVVARDVGLPAAAAARGIEPHVWGALKYSIFRGASDAHVMMAVDYCRSRGLNPMKRHVHIVRFWDADAGAAVEQIFEGIATLRTEAERTGRYLGAEDTEFGADVEMQFGAAKLRLPEWARVVINVVDVQGQERRRPGPKVYMAEFAQTKRDGTLTAQWAKKPRYMLEKCAEAAALRKAFPDELGGLTAAEEMEGADYPGPSAPPPPPPARQQIAALPQPDRPATQSHRMDAPSQPQPIPPTASVRAEDLDDTPPLPEDGDDGDPAAAYEWVTSVGEVMVWPVGQEQSYVTCAITELRNAARQGADALNGLWETNRGAVALAPPATAKEIAAEHDRLVTVLGREAARATQQPPTAAASAPPQTAGRTRRAGATMPPTQQTATAAPPSPASPAAPPADDLF